MPEAITREEHRISEIERFPEGCLHLDGNQPSMGSLRYFGVEIPAMGPHVHPLSNANLFGMYQYVEGSSFASVFANREVWFEVPHFLDEGRILMKFIGMQRAQKISFVLYVRAEQAVIENRPFFPKTLHQYIGPSQQITFHAKGSVLSCISQEKVNMQLIPLAGEGAFQDSQFLLAYEISHYSQRVDLFLEGLSCVV